MTYFFRIAPPADRLQAGRGMMPAPSFAPLGVYPARGGAPCSMFSGLTSKAATITLLPVWERREMTHFGNTGQKALTGEGLRDNKT